jgi:aminoglycoside 3-N-acetyltransferase
MPYDFESLCAAYRDLGLSEGHTVYVAGDLTKLMDFEERSGRAVLGAHDRAIRAAIGEGGTVVVSTASLNICNTEIPFDPATTPSHRRGAFSEHIRRAPGARRSFHPFRSYAALGAKAADIVDNVARNATGPETPEARLVEADAVAVSIGLHPRVTCSAVHHVEQLMGVPYRYIKEFLHPVVRAGATAIEPFYMHVWYRDMDLERDGNAALFERIGGDLDLRMAEIGGATLYAYPVRSFVEATTRAMAEDIYAWCRRPPTRRPYQS